jgi:hypothetical protein
VDNYINTENAGAVEKLPVLLGWWNDDLSFYRPAFRRFGTNQCPHAAT